MLTEKLEIFKSTRSTLQMLLCYTKNVSRDIKYAEWTDIRQKAWKAMDLIYVINSEKDPGRSAELVNMYLTEMYGVTNRIRLIAEEGYIPVRFKTQLLIKIEECTRQGVGWRGYFERKSQNQGVKAN